MHPIRLLILALLFYILFRLLFGGKKKKPVPPPASETNGCDTLEEDPVCHTYIPRQEAVRLEEKDRTLFFCSEKCRADYMRENNHKP